MKTAIIMLLFGFISVTCKSQLVADFVTTNGVNGGCSPFATSFKNTSKGTGTATTYQWNFGNGNTSTLQNPGATYTTEQTYTVTLTITDGGVTSTKQKTITVYKKPTVNFSIVNTTGCLPYNTLFKSNSVAGDGTIAGYFWDFGDGKSQSSNDTSLASISHIYANTQSPKIILVVTNSFGCQASLSKDTFITVNQPPVAAFTISDSVLCRLSDTIFFTNSTTGPGTISYQWAFGDGSFAFTKNATHVYATTGVFDITLKATSNLGVGCTSTVKKPTTIVIANFTSNFIVPSPVCIGTPINLTANNSPNATLTQWSFSEDNYATTLTGSSVTKTFANADSVTIKMINTYGNCKDTILKKIKLNVSPTLSNFIITNDVMCRLPVFVTVKDTSTNAVKWLWNLNGSNVNTDTTSTVTASYQNEGTYNIALTITSSNGCSSTITKPFVVTIPKFTITNIASTSSTGVTGCPGFKLKFGAAPAADIASYVWNFGDSSATSTDAQPSHTFIKEGISKVSLAYVTKDGCTGSTIFNTDVIVYKKPIVNFTISDTITCGSNAITLTDSSIGPATRWDWFFGDGTSAIGSEQIVKHKYYDSGYYKIKLITYNNTCSDSIIKNAYLKVLPLFVDINTIVNTCNGIRDSVHFFPKYRFVDSVTWRYGDGTFEVLSPLQTDVLHVYKKTGTYLVGITISNNLCTYMDSTLAFVLLKQKPLLITYIDTICQNDTLKVTVKNFEKNPDLGKNYLFNKWQFDNASTFTGNNAKPLNFVFADSLQDMLWNLKKGNQTIRAILQTERFGCYDTTNHITLYTKGPIAGFDVVNNQICFKQPIIFKDTSTGVNGVNIISRQWNFGDGSSELRTNGSNFPHNYITPGSYNVQLTVTDAEGCFNVAQNTIKPIQIFGPKADFTWNPNIILTGTSATFTNITNTFGSGNTGYEWHFSSNGLTSNSNGSIIQFYNNSVTVDTVRLIARNTSILCVDTVIKIIPIRKMGLQFNYTTTYVNQSNCPPLVASFTTMLQRVNSISWDFGDGGTAGNIASPTHTYSKPGTYKITLYGYGNNNLIDSVSDFITIKGPFASISANSIKSCLPFTVTLSAKTENAASFIWDFGDGSISTQPDTVITHQYLTPGIYTPALIMKDSVGCSVAFGLASSIIVDSLQANLLINAKAVCEAGTFNFSSKITSISDSLNASSTQYHWTFGTNNPADTSNNKSPSFFYNTVGKYQVALTVTTASGCTKRLIDTIEVKPIAVTTITAPPAICEADSVRFTATTSIPTNVTYEWQFGNNNTSTSFIPNAQKYIAANLSYTILLISTINGCSDTSSANMQVLTSPAINLAPRLANICLGDSILLTANNGVTYQWHTNAPSAGNTYYAKPAISSSIAITVTNLVGCVSRDSAIITVTQPFKLTVSNAQFICVGRSATLSATGADKYQWIGNTAGLSNTTIANPVVTPTASNIYTVVGFDNFGCFTDTATVAVTVVPLPTVNAGADIMIGTGTPATLQATSSANVVKWTWSPATYLSCTNCQTTVTTPRSAITYTVTAATQYGCEAKDSINISLTCIQGNLYIPTGFTPNKDKLNDTFYPLGRGIKSVKHFAIFNRAGQIIYEKANFNVNDASSGWNGTFKGIEVQSGVYVYMIEVVCDTGDIFSAKGTVTIIR
ncbi:MAG: PKD domain-containing protein [Deinococcales bacterium]|nr:PKD domain-containing protein [Chitinophagaceae bacterium]